MLNISKDQECFTMMVFFEVSASQQRWVLDINIEATQDKIRHMPGFVGVAFLRSLDGERVTEYIQWKSEGHLQEAMNDPEFFEHIPRLERIASYEVSPHEVHHAIRGDPQIEHGAVKVTRDAGLLTAIRKFAVGPDEQYKLLRLLVASHEPLLRDTPGFLSANILRSLDGEYVVDYLQFEDREAFDAFELRAETSVYQKIADLAHAKMSLYEVDFISTAADGREATSI